MKFLDSKERLKIYNTKDPIDLVLNCCEILVDYNGSIGEVVITGDCRSPIRGSIPLCSARNMKEDLWITRKK